MRFLRHLDTGKPQRHMGKVKASKVSQLKPKKKCCRKKTRCIKCPVVIMRMKKLESAGASKKELKAGLKKARAA
ncbi:hypothetical protein B2J88_03665 [Rhodococcus sp. SRB_17]|uniref:hypothetical protein n=2 Tax=Rhodococcus TaxID=1827 RepID=UPI00113FEE70|nr:MULTISPECIES: hypothetical protein [unclassified Rhodococcus (in: high G+C Gram-positive bacteria)]MCJ0904646.1 hypothetical protein [Rhodococcus sp. ARC_M6]MDI9917351.1 hypothetical protein [Rhodococcus sp. IEGM 1379]NMM83466.1 hypothetical protein [Rhodococcus sp. SRB_17]